MRAGGHALPRSLRRLTAAAITGLVLVGPLALLESAAPAVAAPANPVVVNVLSVSPNSPSATNTPTPLTFTISLTNTTTTTITGVTVSAERGDPIQSQAALDAALKTPQPPTPSLAGLVTKPDYAPTPISLPAQTSTQLTITTASSTLNGAGLCICLDAIYPIYFTAQSTATDGTVTTLGTAQTYVPSFPDTPRPVQVGWIWPLLERPHRLGSDTVFTDDALAAAVGPNGRLDHLLSVAEAVGPTGVPMTIVADPELIDELQVMTTGYQVPGPNGRLVAGTGGPVASAWLARLRHLLDTVPQMEMSLTPYADPDIEALTRNGLGWSSDMPAGMQARVETALGGRSVRSDIVWPVAGRISADTLAAVVRRGAQTVILDSSQLASTTDDPQTALAPLPSEAGSVTAAVTTAQVDQYVGPVLSVGGAGLSQLPELVSEVAIRAVVDPSTSNYVLITPPRNLDPDPTVAAAAIRAVSSTSWSTALPLRAATETILATGRGGLAPTAGGSTLAPQALSTAQYVADVEPSLTSMFDAADAKTTLSGLPTSVQRLESAEWAGQPALLTEAGTQVRSRIDDLVNGVHLVVPTSGSYTLGSPDSPLPVTIDNTLPVAVLVRVALSAVGNLPGFRADAVAVQKIPPLGKLPLHVPVHVERAGRIRVQAVLSAPAVTAEGPVLQLGATLDLSVRSTALGSIGKIITILAGTVLGLALLVRVVRRIRAGRPVPR